MIIFYAIIVTLRLRLYALQVAHLIKFLSRMNRDMKSVDAKSGEVIETLNILFFRSVKRAPDHQVSSQRCPRN